MNSAQLCGVSQYTMAKGSMSTPVTAGTNQLLPSNVMTSATSAVGYSHGILYLEHDAITINTAAQDEHCNINESTNNHHHHNHNSNVNNDGGDDDDDTDSFASMETLSDNVSIWVDGEKHWISGVDANTTCGDLIWALLNYQDGPQMFDASANDNEGSAASNTNNNHTNDTTDTKNNNGNNAINQSTTNTKEDCKAIAATSASLLSEYVIVKQHRHCEEYLDGSTKVFDVLPPPSRDVPARKECELLLRHLASPSPRIATQVSSLLSTDKDSGMGSPGPIVDGSTRSSKFRRRKHKSSNWLAQGNTLHPKLSQRSNTANERLLKIILAQDETIHRQLSMLREKERQISKIEVEKHRVRQRELGKNYLLETYLNGLDVAEAEPEVEVVEDGVEIFIDEPYYRLPTKATTKTTTTTKKTTTTTTSTQKWSLLHRQQRKQRKDEDCCIAAAAPKSNLPTDGRDEKQTSCTAATTNVTSAATLGGNQKEIELQILWLEKVYSINKQLQREEELLLKLHAKIRKHQVKRAYQTKKEVIQQIDKLDSELALQCADIRRVEYSLVTSSEQLEQKLCILEKLSQEFQMAEMATEQPPPTINEISAQPAAASIDADADMAVDSAKNANNKQLTTTAAQSLGMCYQHQQPQPLPQLESGNCTTMVNEKLVSDGAQLLGEDAAQTPQKLNFSQMHSPEDLLNLQKLIAKPTQTTAMQSPLQPATMAEQPASYSLKSSLMQCTAALKMTLHHQSGMLQHNNNYPISRHNQPHRGADLSHPSSSCTPQQLIDKNSLLLHVNNAKTVKKQMFGPKSLNQAMVVAAAPSTGIIQAAIIHNETTSSKNYDTPAMIPPTSLDVHVDFTCMGTLV